MNTHIMKAKSNIACIQKISFKQKLIFHKNQKNQIIE